MSIINEDLARRNKENYGFDDYKAGSATAEYNAEIARVAALIENAKAKVSEKSQARLDNLLSRYATQYANWVNKSNSNGASHVSVMISGSSNYNMRAHEKFMSREEKLWKEYEELKDIEYKIHSIVASDKIIRSDDADAIEKLQIKIDKLEKNQENMKAANAIIRKKTADAEKVEQLITLLNCSEKSAKELLLPDFCGRIGFPSYALTNNNATIRTAKQRLEHLKKLAEKAAETPTKETEINGIKIVDNLEAQRLQIVFSYKPDADVREKLKKNGFRWSPSNGAWQRFRGDYSERIAKEIVESL